MAFCMSTWVQQQTIFARSSRRNDKIHWFTTDENKSPLAFFRATLQGCLLLDLHWLEGENLVSLRSSSVYGARIQPLTERAVLVLVFFALSLPIQPCQPCSWRGA